MPPPAEGFAARFVIGPALRTQPDRRLVSLVREGYENAFEEIVRRYGKALTRYAGAIVGSRAEDVTQDAFSKALLALRRDGAEIELRPWLFRIVRNTALNDLRDSPPSAEALAEVIAGGANPAEELERREELADLMRRLQSLPEAQRAAIVMRELEGLSHEEIAGALGLSDGGARQAIYRARRSLRDAAGALLPLPLLKAMLAGAAGSPAVEAAAGVGGAAGAGVALKAAAATVLVAGAVGAGVAIDRNHHQHQPTPPATNSVVAEDSVTPAPSTGREPATTAGGGPLGGSGQSGEGESGDDHRRHGHNHGSGDSGDDHGGNGNGSGAGETDDNSGSRGSGGGGDHEEPGDDRGGGPGPSGRSGSDDGGGGHSGRGPGGSSGSNGGSSGGSSGEGGGSGSSSGSGSGPSGDVSGSTSGGGSGSGGSGSSGGPGSGDDGSGSGSGSSGSGEEGESSEPNFDSSGDSHGGSGFSVQMEPQTEEES
jgi:RNA polymerase sigma factor (sigma-70 family)